MSELRAPPGHERFRLRILNDGNDEIEFDAAGVGWLYLCELNDSAKEDCGAVAFRAWRLIADRAMVSSNSFEAEQFTEAYDQAELWSKFAEG